ncbi:uridylate kinase Ura6 [Lophiotrema nucula]|uniref:Uridylate kinase Ura6 n=1 Tax=Lophiotrema nucula TaxID=690887 RepID=A0A6A5ZB43_9PLEO|nr:uridylate kinase Ura6 [Lophiotrema nucula]
MASHDTPIVVAVLGGPGTGKSTQCARLQSEFHCTHLSIGDILRAEAVNSESSHRELLIRNLAEGRVGPKEMTVGILQRAMKTAFSENQVEVFLLDGFPRALATAQYFEAEVAPISLLLFLEHSETSVVIERLLARNRADDTRVAIEKRLKVFKETTMEVFRHYEQLGKGLSLDASGSEEEVYQRAVEALRGWGIGMRDRDQVCKGENAAECNCS